MQKNTEISQLRQMIAVEAAKIIISLKITNFNMARKQAAKSLRIRLSQKEIVPSNKEIQQQVNKLSYLYQNINNNTKKIPEQEKYKVYHLLLQPLENIVKHDHPEGDLLYHSLQVFQLAQHWYGYDVEFLEAALLHDIGEAIDSKYHAEAGAHAVEDFVSERTFFLIRYHNEANLLRKNALGHKQKVFLKNHEYFDDLIDLSKMDEKGRESGIEVPSLQKALSILSELESTFLSSY